MKQILWFRRDLRIQDSAILAKAKDEVLPIFIFDKNILDKLDANDKRVTFLYNSVLALKKKLQSINLDLAIFYSYPKEVFTKLSNQNFDEILCSVDFDSYAKKRDEEISKILPMKKCLDSFLTNPINCLKKDNTPYKVFTPYYNSLDMITSSKLQTYQTPKTLKKISFDYSFVPSLEDLGFKKQVLPDFLNKTAEEVIDDFLPKMRTYQKDRDFFNINATSNISVHLRFGLISVKKLFNQMRDIPNSEFFIRELFWREFYNYILYHFPKSEFENFNNKHIPWRNNEDEFKKWCEGNTGTPIIDAAMRHFNNTGTMHNRIRMIVSSYLCKNLLIDWKWGERYFASKLLDYEASSNIGSWQWAASTGADSVPYFRIFNPYTQSVKFDKEAVFIKSVIPELRDILPKDIHTEYGLTNNLLINYPTPIIDIKESRLRAIDTFKHAKTKDKL